MVVWARRTLAQRPDGVVEVAPAAVETLATMIGRTRDDLAAYLARFLPELDRIPGQLHRNPATIETLEIRIVHGRRARCSACVLVVRQRKLKAANDGLVTAYRS
jgi:hypothetical protein